MTGDVNGRTLQSVIDSVQRVVLWSPAGEPLAAPVQELLNTRYAVEAVVDLPQPAAGEVVVLMCRSPAEYLCRVLVQDQNPGLALQAWQAQAQAVLDLQRRYRRQVCIFDAGQISRAPEAFLAYFGLSVSPAEAARLAEQDTPDPVLMALAAERLRADSRLAALAGEFTASRVPLAEVAAEPDAALGAYLENQEMMLELNLLQDQQRSMYEQAEALYSAKLAAERQLEEAELQAEQRLLQMRNGLDSYQSQVDTLQAELDKLRTDFATAQARLQSKQAILDTASGAIAELEAVAGIRAREVQDLKEQIGRFESSKSFRITAPFRRLRQIISLKGYA